MSITQPTLDDIWRLFQETDRKYKELANDLFASQKETNRLFKETNKKLGDFPTGGFSPPEGRCQWCKPPAFCRFLFSRRFSPPIVNPPALAGGC